MDRGLVTARIHQSPIRTPLILTGIWYPPAWSGAACGASGTRTNVPTSITGQRSIKWPGSPQRQQASPGLFTDKLKQVRTLRVLKTSTLSVVSAITLSIRSGGLSLTDRAPESSLRLSPWTPVPRWFYLVSTPITAIRHRCSSFCTWPTYLPLSPESFSRCRLRWTTPPSPQSPTCSFHA